MANSLPLYSEKQILNEAISGRAKAVTPSDTGYLEDHGYLYIGNAGHLVVLPSEFPEGVTEEGVTFENVQEGFFAFRVKRVYATGTTATAINVIF